MNLNFIYSAVVALNFVVKFHVSSEEKQDYFLFTGPNSTAHLYRTNNTLWLYLGNGEENRVMKCKVDNPTFTFDWISKTVDDNLMSNFSNIDVWFDAYTFLSPILEIQQPSTPTPIVQGVKINYLLIALLIVSIGLGLKFDVVAPLIMKLLKKESLYVNMEL